MPSFTRLSVARTMVYANLTTIVSVPAGVMVLYELLMAGEIVGCIISFCKMLRSSNGKILFNQFGGNRLHSICNFSSVDEMHFYTIDIAALFYEIMDPANFF